MRCNAAIVRQRGRAPIERAEGDGVSPLGQLPLFRPSRYRNALTTQSFKFAKDLPSRKLLTRRTRLATHCSREVLTVAANLPKPTAQNHHTDSKLNFSLEVCSIRLIMTNLH
eukprot:scaffold48_cov161-Amphora_coffeaeformis.AAC.13